MADKDELEQEKHLQIEQGQSEETPTPTDDTDLQQVNKYKILPGLDERFKSLQIKEVIAACMSEQLLGQTYSTEQAAIWAKQIANNIRVRAEKICNNRYRILVWTSVAEMRGAGLTSAVRCVWDPDTDNLVHDHFHSNTLYAHTAVFGIYLY